MPYGDADAVARTLESSKLAGAGIAAVIMEPIQVNYHGNEFSQNRAKQALSSLLKTSGQDYAN